MLEVGCASALFPVLLESLEQTLGGTERALKLLERAVSLEGGAAARGGGGGAAARAVEAPRVCAAGASAADRLEEGLCTRFGQLVGALHVLCKTQVEGAPAQKLMQLCAGFYKQLEAYFKEARTSRELSLARLERLLEQVSTELTPALYGLMVNTTNASSSSGRADSSAKLRRDAALMPKVVFQLERFEATVVKLAKDAQRRGAPGHDLLRFMRKATNRDFKISLGDVQQILKENNSKKADKAEKAFEKEQRKADKPKGGGKKSDANDKKRRAAGEARGGGGGGGGTKRPSTDSGRNSGRSSARSSGRASPISFVDDGPREEGEREGEEEVGYAMASDEEAEGEDMDAYPASMLA